MVIVKGAAAQFCVVVDGWVIVALFYRVVCVCGYS